MTKEERAEELVKLYNEMTPDERKEFFTICIYFMNCTPEQKKQILNDPRLFNESFDRIYQENKDKEN